MTGQDSAEPEAATSRQVGVLTRDAGPEAGGDPEAIDAERRPVSTVSGLARDAVWSVRAAATRTRELGHDLLQGPEHRTLRRILLVGFALRFLLAPLTAWGLDTTFFAFSDTNLLFAGSAYRADTFYNPPLGPIVELPGVALLAVLVPAHQLIQFVPGLVPVATTTGMFAPYLPSPLFLLAMKTPLLLADGAVALLLYRLVRQDGSQRWATLAAAGWFLNPLVFWASAVHGEVDTLAALGVLGVLYAWRHGHPLAGGIALGLGAAAKVYPLLFLPVAVLLFAGRLGSEGARRRVLLFVAGFGIAVLPFLVDLAGLAQIVAHQSGNNNFGGLSVLIVLNTGLEPWAVGLPPVVNSLAALVFVVTLPATVALAAWLVVRRPDRFGRQQPNSLGRVAMVGTAILGASLLAILSPQAENLIALIPLLFLAVPVLGRSAKYAAAAVSAFGWAQYLSLLGPLAFFYPLAQLLGPTAISALNAETIGYGTSVGLFSQVSMWVALGILGGIAILLTWGRIVGWMVVESRTPLSHSELARVTVPRDRQLDGSHRRWIPSGPAVRTGFTTSVLALLTVALVGATGVLSTSRATAPLYEATVVAVGSGLTSSTASVTIQVGAVAMDAHVGLIPGSRWPAGPIDFFADPAYPSPYATYTQVRALAERVAVSLGASGAGRAVSIVDSAGLSAELATTGPATVVVIGGLLPDTVLRGAASPLERWILAGGSLVWAGGPLGFTEGHPLPNGTFYWDPLLWEAQLDLVGFPLSDPGNGGPLSASTPSSIAATLGLAYNGTPSGANVTQVSHYGGTILGWTTGPGPQGESARASLVSIPVGAGRVLFFGGAFVAATRPQQYVPLADFTLSADLALLFQTGFAAHGSGGVSVNLELAAGARRTVTVTGPFVSPEALLIVSAPSVPVFFASFAVYLDFASPAASGGGATR
jgi:hypothetical protein